MKRSIHVAAAGLAIASLAEPARAASPPETEIDHASAYAIDADTFELVHYVFATDEFTVIGTVETAGGVTIENCESLGFIRYGAAKGLYSVPTKSAPFARQLVKIDPLTAEATVFGPTVCSSGRKITGMTDYDVGGGNWQLLAVSSEELASDPDRIETRELIRIDPLSGTSTVVATQAQLGDGRRFEGLGIDSNGDWWATGRQWFYRIHQEAGYWVEEIAPTSLDKAEAFEVAVGDFQASITIPGVDPSWTTNGVFFVHDEQIQKFGVLNPADGSFVEYLYNGSPSSFVTKDAEGLIVLTYRQDPAYGVLITFD